MYQSAGASFPMFSFPSRLVPVVVLICPDFPCFWADFPKCSSQFGLFAPLWLRPCTRARPFSFESSNWNWSNILRYRSKSRQNLLLMPNFVALVYHPTGKIVLPNLISLDLSAFTKSVSLPNFTHPICPSDLFTHFFVHNVNFFDVIWSNQMCLLCDRPRDK